LKLIRIWNRNSEKKKILVRNFSLSEILLGCEEHAYHFLIWLSVLLPLATASDGLIGLLGPHRPLIPAYRYRPFPLPLLRAYYLVRRAKSEYLQHEIHSEILL
jgi:hypothetical protein